MDVVATNKGMALRFKSVDDIDFLIGRLEWLKEQTHKLFVNAEDESEQMIVPKVEPPYVLGLFDSSVPIEAGRAIVDAAKLGKVA